MPRGGRLTIETRQVTLTQEYTGFKSDVFVRPGPYVLLSVSDTGHGMDATTLNRAFDPFFTTKSIGQGTGLGLSSVYGIVKQSEGYVWAYSEPGQGATFKIYLPVDTSASSLPPQSPDAAGAGAGEMVLVVEDEEAVRTMLHRLLESEGYEVLEASDGQQALVVIEGAASGGPGDHRCGHAGVERAPARGPAKTLPPRAAGSLHVRLYRRRNGATRVDRAGPPLPGEAV